jgi:hypothetical protein
MLLKRKLRPNRHNLFSLHLSHREEFKEKTFELELSWVCDDSKNVHTFVPKDLVVRKCGN